MNRLLTTLSILLCLLSLVSGPVAATDVTSLIQPTVLDPKVDRLLVMGLPLDRKRVWKERTFTNDNGNRLALCVDHLTSQRIFPAAGRAIADGLFCLADLTITGVHQFSATVFVASRLLDTRSKPMVIVPNCTILRENGQDNSEGNTQDSRARQHVVLCPMDNEGRSGLIGSFNTYSSGIRDGLKTEVDGIWINTQFETTAHSSG